MPARIERLSASVGWRHLVTAHEVSLMTRSIRRMWALQHQTGAHYSVVQWTRAKVAVRNAVAPAPQTEPASSLKSATRYVNLLRSDSRRRWYVTVRPNVIQGYVASEQKGMVSLLIFSSRLTSLLLRWKTANAAFVVLSFNFQVWRYSPTVAMSLFCTPSTVFPSPWACMIARSLAYAYFLETMASRSEI